ncbi:HNH homing endonuclease [Staphylococcus phage vB_SAP01]|nr:HNH homing endonuclease [Staphylococcus phage vB_SAP01]
MIENKINEEWKLIKKLSNENNKYYVSSNGIVKSNIRGKEHTLTNFTNKKGYLMVRVAKRNIRVHRLIYEYFIGNIPKGYHIHHIDGNKQNNCIDNLECVSPSEHTTHHNKTDDFRYKRGKAPTQKEIKEIKQKYKPYKYTMPMLAKEYNLSIDSIKYILKN